MAYATGRTNLLLFTMAPGSTNIIIGNILTP